MIDYTGKTLAEIGELRLIDEIILPMARSFDLATRSGDDCAFIEVGEKLLAATGDVGPRPVIQNLAAHREDWEAAGWLAVVATASDVASAAAKPLFMTNCIDAPPDLPVEALRSFMHGYFSALTAFGFRNGGGDLRHGRSLLARVFGVGVVEHGRRIGRSGTSQGDHLVVIGPAGSFMASFLTAMAVEGTSSRTIKPDDSPILMRFPRPQLDAMQCLASLGLIVAASDTSDGLLGAIHNIAKASSCSFHLSLDDAMLAPEIWTAASQFEVNSPWNIFFAWGDWSVAVVVPAGRLDELSAVCGNNGFVFRHLGVATLGQGLTAQFNGGDDIYGLAIVRNENFVLQGFNSGIEAHLEYILQTPLFSNVKNGARVG
jgi:thiamine-monophosphate kinase